MGEGRTTLERSIREFIALGSQASAYHHRMGLESGQAYSRRAAEYTELFGSMSTVHPSDRQLVDTWADTLTGRVLDAGCGPGQWTNHLIRQGVSASGVDLSEEFIASARTAHPKVLFEVGNLDALSAASGSLGGLLSWYTLIHHEPSTIQIPLTEFARVLRPGGGLLIGYFEGPSIEKFNHAVSDAYTWPVAELSRELNEAGFDVVESHTRTAAQRHRPHGAIVAHRR